MVQYNLELTEAENKAFTYAATDTQFWIENVVKERIRKATEEIVKICVDKCLENDIQIPSSKEDMVLLAFEQNWVITAEEKLAQLTNIE